MALQTDLDEKPWESKVTMVEKHLKVVAQSQEQLHQVPSLATGAWTSWETWEEEDEDEYEYELYEGAGLPFYDNVQGCFLVLVDGYPTEAEFHTADSSFWVRHKRKGFGWGK